MNDKQKGSKTILFLKRVTMRNDKRYNPLEDKMLLKDVVDEIQLRVKPLILTKQQKNMIESKFYDIKDMLHIEKIKIKMINQIKKIFL